MTLKTFVSRVPVVKVQSCAQFSTCIALGGLITQLEALAAKIPTTETSAEPSAAGVCTELTRGRPAPRSGLHGAGAGPSLHTNAAGALYSLPKECEPTSRVNYS